MMVDSGFVVGVGVVVVVVVVEGGTVVVVVVVDGGTVVVVVRGGTVVVVLGGGVWTGGLVVVVVVGPAGAAAVVGFGAGFNTRADAETGAAATRAAAGVFRPASSGAGNAKSRGAVLPRLLPVANEETAHGGNASGRFVVDGAAGVKTIDGGVFVSIDLAGAPFDGSVSS